MIQDKKFSLRLIKQLTEALEKVLLGKPEQSLMQNELDFNALLIDIFKMDFTTLSSLSMEDLLEMIRTKEPKDQPDYYLLFGNLFYLNALKSESFNLQSRAKTFYQLHLKTSQTFSFPIIDRINEIDLGL